MQYKNHSKLKEAARKHLEQEGYEVVGEEVSIELGYKLDLLVKKGDKLIPVECGHVGLKKISDLKEEYESFIHIKYSDVDWENARPSTPSERWTKEMKRPHIVPEIHKKVEKLSKNLDVPQYEIYETLVNHFIDKNGRWKPNASIEGLKKKLGRPLESTSVETPL